MSEGVVVRAAAIIGVYLCFGEPPRALCCQKSGQAQPAHTHKNAEKRITKSDIPKSIHIHTKRVVDRGRAHSREPHSEYKLNIQSHTC